MRTLLIAFMLASAITSFAVETNQIVYLGEFGFPRIQQEWIGKSVRSIIGDAQISQFIITKSVSSAPLEMHTERIKSVLREDFVFQDPSIDKSMDFFFDAILLMDDGHRFRIRMNRLWTCLTSPTGSGYFYTEKEIHVNATDNANVKE